MVEQQQQLRSLADDYALKQGPRPRSPPPPPLPSPSSQIVASGITEESKQEAAQGDIKNVSGEGTSGEAKLTSSDNIEGERQEEKHVQSTRVEMEEEEEECGFCLFMKGGGCKENFIAWEKCMEEAENNKEDLVEKCYEVTGQLMKCMEAHADYYEPILRAEKAMKEDVARKLEQDRETMSDVTASTATELE